MISEALESYELTPAGVQGGGREGLGWPIGLELDELLCLSKRGLRYGFHRIGRALVGVWSWVSIWRLLGRTARCRR